MDRQEMATATTPARAENNPANEKKGNRKLRDKVTARLIETKFLDLLWDGNDGANAFWTWGYKIEITNPLDKPIKVLERHWLIEPIDHAAQKTDGYGIGGERVTIAPHTCKTYVSGVPLPTPRGGTMRGYFVVEIEGGETINVPIKAFDLTEAEASIQIRPKPDRRETAKLDQQIDAYIAKCANGETAMLDAAKLPTTLRWPFERLCLGQRGTVIFNSIKQGTLSKVDIRAAVGGLFNVKNPILEYNDILLYGDDFNSLRVCLLNYSKKEGLMQKPLQEVLKQWGVPESHFEQVAAEMERIARQCAKGITRPKRAATAATAQEPERAVNTSALGVRVKTEWLPVSELTEDQRTARRTYETKKKQRWRARQAAKAAASPSP